MYSISAEVCEKHGGRWDSIEQACYIGMSNMPEDPVFEQFKPVKNYCKENDTIYKLDRYGRVPYACSYPPKRKKDLLDKVIDFFTTWE